MSNLIRGLLSITVSGTALILGAKIMEPHYNIKTQLDSHCSRAVALLPIPNKLIVDSMPDATMFRLICLQEGNGRIDLTAYNESEDARGPAQIRPGYLHDANEWLSWQGQHGYTHDQMHDYDCAYRVCLAYWQRYRLHTLEQRARAHNGGPDGPYQDCTIGYWIELQSRI